MLKIGCLISGFFQLVLRVPPKLTPDAVNKNFRVLEVFLEEDFEFGSCDGSGVFVAAFMLSHLRLIEPQKNEAINRVQFTLMAPDVLK